MIDLPQALAYSNIVALDIVKRILTIAAFNGLNVNFFDTDTAFINFKIYEEVYFIAGPYF